MGELDRDDSLYTEELETKGQARTGYALQNKNATLCAELLAAVQQAIERYEGLKREHELHLRHHNEANRSNAMHKRMVEQLLQDVSLNEQRNQAIRDHMDKREQSTTALYAAVHATKAAEISELKRQLADMDARIEASQVQAAKVNDLIREAEAEKIRSKGQPQYEPLLAVDGQVTFYHLVPKALPVLPAITSDSSHLEVATISRQTSSTILKNYLEMEARLPRERSTVPEIPSYAQILDNPQGSEGLSRRTTSRLPDPDDSDGD